MIQPHEWPAEFLPAAKLLLKAAKFAEMANRSLWDFAVEISDLRQLGISGTDLRWLVCQGFVEHADESFERIDDARVFHATGKLAFGPRTCFILTVGGNAAASRLKTVATSHVRANPSPHVRGRQQSTSALERNRFSAVKPRWNREMGQLLVGDLLVKHYRRPAPNQQLVLSAFEEEEWPLRIDDPLPPAPEIEPKRRLHETITALNRNQHHRVLRFIGDGSGRGIIWRCAMNDFAFPEISDGISAPDQQQINGRSEQGHRHNS